jgi:hypothetical protein
MITRRADNQYVVVKMMKDIMCFAVQYLAWQHARLQARLKRLQHFATTAPAAASTHLPPLSAHAHISS